MSKLKFNVLVGIVFVLLLFMLLLLTACDSYGDEALPRVLTF